MLNQSRLRRDYPTHGKERVFMKKPLKMQAPHYSNALFRHLGGAYSPHNSRQHKLADMASRTVLACHLSCLQSLK